VSDKKYPWAPKELDQKDLETASLPVPRLEIRWERLGDNNARATYSLVYRHLLGHDMRVPLGFTDVDGAVDSRLQSLDTPFLDGAHINSEMKSLRLRGFVSYGNLWRELEPRP
jgi:hypothetical protein